MYYPNPYDKHAVRIFLYHLVKFVRDAILSGLWAWVTLGTEKFQGPSKRRIIMTNILVMLVSVLCVPHVIFFAIYDAQGLIVPIIIISLVAIAFFNLRQF